MSRPEKREGVPLWFKTAGALFLTVSLAYAFISGFILLWLISVIGIGVSTVVLYLFYRLVRAVEEIAHKL